MKYPESFTLVDRCSGFTLEVKYDQTTGTYMLNYGNGFKGFHKEHYIDDLISVYYDIKPEKYHQYPDNFSFYHDTTAQMYDMVKLPHHELWACTDHTDGPQWVISGVTYTADEIAEHFAKGHWKEVASEAAPRSSRKLVFPFTIEDSGIRYTIFDSRTEGKTHLYDHAHNRMTTDYFDYSECRELIAEGLWRVTSVGEISVGTQRAPEASTSPSTDNSALTIKVESEAVLEASKRLSELADATERLNIALESFKTIFADVQDMLAPQKFAACDLDFYPVISPFNS